MGEVWRATDTKLGRDVAIKILPEVFAADPERLARFEREARVLASLNHPNIAAIHGVEERALVLELVEGPTLADRIAQGPIPLEEALAIAAQIAEALEYAHERGVIHRDLKPANIKVSRDRVKLLDFGLAKAMAAEIGTANPANSPTLTMRSTVAGMILGTAGYMSPEQARGQEVDARADIWAFGVVLYEMLTGRALFTGPTVSDTLATVLKTEPDLTGLPASVRPAMERCLRKDPRRRWRAIGDVRMALEEGLGAPGAAPAAARSRALPWGVAAVLGIALLAAGGLLWRATRPPDRPLMRFNVDLGPDALTGLNLTAAISPDGRRLVFAVRGPGGKPQLATRLLEQAQPTLIPGTEDAENPFFSPDSQRIAFNSGGHIREVSVQGGAPAMVQSTSGSTPFGAAWGDDGNMVAALGSLVSLSRFPASGGPARFATTVTGADISHRWPQVLPGGKIILYSTSIAASRWDDGDIAAAAIQTGQSKVLHHGGYFGRYLPAGYLVYVHQGALYAVKFDAGRLEVQGTPVPMLDDVAGNPTTGGGQFDFSNTGTLVYAAGKSSVQSWNLAWMDASGQMRTILPASGAYTTPRFSPDGRKLAYIGEGSDVFIYDLERDTTTQLTFTGRAATPLWTPDGKHIVFRGGSAGGTTLQWLRSDGAGDPQHLMEAQTNVVPGSFSPDGRTLLYFGTDAATGFDIWSVPLDIADPERPKTGKPEPFLRTPADELMGRFSPDGRWVAYRSNATGNMEIYVRPFQPGGAAASGGKWLISNSGGLYPVWGNNGRQLFYETTDYHIMVVDYTVDGATFVPGKPRLWSDRRLFYSGTNNLDLAPDDKRFVVFSLPESEPGAKGSVHVTVLLNFFDELKRRLP
jgi:serine/threonine-protein kinase